MRDFIENLIESVFIIIVLISALAGAYIANSVSAMVNQGNYNVRRNI